MDIVEKVRLGHAEVEWFEIVSKRDGDRLYLKVFRDGLKIEGVRASATSRQLQQIADLLDCLLLTPKVIDLIWLQAGLRFDSVIRADGDIVARSSDKRVSGLIDAEIDKLGGDQGQLIDSIGKYWVLENLLEFPAQLRHLARTACTYGWMSSTAPSAALTPDIKCWQRPNCFHDDAYSDPSQVIRLMQREARLARADGSEKPVDLRVILQDPALAPLVNHDGVLRYLRVATVPAPGVPGALPAISPYTRPAR